MPHDYIDYFVGCWRLIFLSIPLTVPCLKTRKDAFLHHDLRDPLSPLFGSQIRPGAATRGTLNATAVSLLPLSCSSCFSSASLVSPVSVASLVSVSSRNPNPVRPLNRLASSLADMGMKRPKSGFMTSREAQIMATLSSMVDQMSAKVPDPDESVSNTCRRVQ
jgi:hypothetical protein